MNVKEYIREQEQKFMLTRDDERLEDRKKIFDMLIDDNVSPNYFNNKVSEIQYKWQQDWYEWLTMNHDFDSFTKKEQEQIKEAKVPIEEFGSFRGFK